MSSSGWIGVDLDGTLAFHDINRGPTHIGKPIPGMVKRVKQWVELGIEVRIFTARVGPGPWMDHHSDVVIRTIQDWTREVIGVVLPVTATKDFGMIELWDDRAIQVLTNTGRAVIVPPEKLLAESK